MVGDVPTTETSAWFRRPAAAVRPETLLSVLCHAVAYLQVYSTAHPSRSTDHWSFQYLVIIGVSLLLTLLIPWMARESVVLFLLCSKFFLLSIIGFPVNVFMGAKLSLFTSFLVDSSMSLGSPKNDVTSVVGAVVFLFFRRFLDAQPVSAHDLLSLTLYAGALVVLLSAVRRQRAFLLKQRDALTKKDAAVRELAAANTGFQQYANVVEERAKASERNAITREIHDTVGHALTNVIMIVKAALALSRKRGHDDVARLLSQAQTQADAAYREIRRELHVLRSIEEAEPSGLRAFMRVARIFEDATGIRVQIEYGNMPWTLGTLIDTTLMRFIQEALTNAHTHGGATLIRIFMWVDESHISVTIQDDGSGAEEIHEGIGFLGMKERIGLLHGDLAYGNLADGFHIRARIPIEAAKHRV